ncbi:MerR family transcriptional regulator [Desulfosporosinus sp. OT]|uniref:MerR family transcriptional regulator n=1 Tax=Desulfosporosinus sp. OT TaxID=913865 RepID=UPI000223B296|nr:MerR family transcriptional regulator [Desulfosporosinus sp. OT]EGW37463.1 merR regulatory family protein [Desulfosporosinus sp. OT]
MEKRMKIGDFVKLTGSTLKTVRYYHKIGLLPKPECTTAGYRLYGPAELNRIRLIKHLKSLGLDLKGIKEILGDLTIMQACRKCCSCCEVSSRLIRKTLKSA